MKSDNVTAVQNNIFASLFLDDALSPLSLIKLSLLWLHNTNIHRNWVYFFNG